MGVQGGFTDDEVRRIRAAIDARDATFDQIAAAIDNLPDPQAALDLANELAETDRKRAGEPIADLRARQVRRIWESEEMTLAELGKRIGKGVTRQRARKMVNDAGGDTTRAAKGNEQEDRNGDASQG